MVFCRSCTSRHTSETVHAIHKAFWVRKGIPTLQYMRSWFSEYPVSVDDEDDVQIETCFTWIPHAVTFLQRMERAEPAAAISAP